MKRPVIAVTVTENGTGEELHRETRGAWNSASVAAIGAIRAIARAEGQLYTGGPIDRTNADRYRLTPGDTMTRLWVGDNTARELIATITVETT